MAKTKEIKLYLDEALSARYYVDSSFSYYENNDLFLKLRGLISVKNIGGRI